MTRRRSERQPASSSGRRVHVIAIGGTIAMTGQSGRRVRPALTGEALVHAVPGLDDVANVEVETFLNVPSAHLRIDDLVRLGRRIGQLVDGGADGIVVTQGTDTIEECAFALDLLGPQDVPIVVTGAMRSPDQPGADGAANLLNAVRTAASGEARSSGCLVALDDTVHAARFVRKSHASRPSAFASPSVGPVGWIAEDRVRLPFRTRRGPRVDPSTVQLPVPSVALIRLALGDDGRLLQAVREIRYAAVVVDAMGVGHIAPWLLEPIAEVAREVPVMFASRTGAGEVFQGTYGFEGSESDLLGAGLLPAGILDGLKARVLASVGLAGGWDSKRLASAIDAFGR